MIWRQWTPPLAVFLITSAFNAFVAYSAGLDPGDPGAWVRMDSGHYLSIATTGYEYLSCAQLRDPAYAVSAWCGNAGWMPGYAWLIRAFSSTGVPPPWAGLIIAAAFYLALLAAVWFWFLKAEWTPSSLLCLLLAGVFPGQIYYHAVFPISAFLFLAAMCLHFAAREKWWQAGLAGAVAAFTYTSGILLAPVVLLGALLTRRVNLRLALAAGMICLGLLAVFALHHYLFGVWDALFKVHGKYGHGINNPLEILRIRTASAGALEPAPLQTVIVLIIVAGALAAAVRARPLTQLDALVAVYVGSYWLFPLVLGVGISLYRAESLLLPAVVLLRRQPWPSLALLALLAAGIAYPMARLFFISDLF